MRLEKGKRRVYPCLMISPLEETGRGLMKADEIQQRHTDALRRFSLDDKVAVEVRKDGLVVLSPNTTRYRNWGEAFPDEGYEGAKEKLFQKAQGCKYNIFVERD